MTYYKQALHLQRATGDRAGEAGTLNNIATCHRDARRLLEAIAGLEQVVALDTAVQHSDLAADTAMLNQV
ncbi:MAG: hypothetical protein ABI382_09870 [Nakamurella sp.]